MTTINDRSDVAVDEWLYESHCPVCGPEAETGVAGAVRPIVWRCSDCGVFWTRDTFERIGDGGAR